MNEANVVFTKHALQRARERHLWKYVSKAKFYYDAKHDLIGRAKLGHCIYAYKYNQDKVYILTMIHA